MFKSTDGGETWNKIQNAGFPSGTGLGRIGIAVAPSNPQIVYAVLDNYNRRPDTAKKKIDSNSYELNKLKTLTVTQFLQLDTARIDTFLKKNQFPKKYRAVQIKELVKQGKLKPTVLYDYLVNINTDTLPPD